MRLDDAVAHQLLPEQVGCRSGELRLGRQDAGERVSRVFPVVRLLAAQQEPRGGLAPQPCDTEHAAACGVVAGSEIVNQEFIRFDVAVLPVHEVASPAQESGLAVEIVPGLAGEVDIDLLEVVHAVVAGDAGQVEAEEGLAVQDRQLVMGVELMHHAHVPTVVWLGLALDMLPSDYIGSGQSVAALPGRCDQGLDPLVVGTVRAQILLEPVVKQLAAPAHLAVGPKQVHVEVRPLLGERLAGEQLVDLGGALPRRPVSCERAHLLGGGDPADQVQLDSAQELSVPSERRMRYAVPSDLAEDAVVNEVPAGDRGAGSERGGGRDPLGEGG